MTTASQRLCIFVSMVTPPQHADENSTSMDDGLQQAAEREQHAEYVTNRRECMESRTVAPAQERVYQQKTPKYVMQKNCKRSIGENVHSLMSKDDKEDANDFGFEDLQIYDSLEVEAYHCYKKNPTVLHTDAAAKKSGRGGESKMLSNNAHSELCNDPNMMPNLSVAGSPQITTEEHYIVPRESDTYIAGTDSVLSVPSHTCGDKRDQLCHRHPQDAHMRPSSSHNDDVTGRLVEIDDPSSCVVLSDNRSNVSAQTEFRGNPECDPHPGGGEAGPELGNNQMESNVHRQPGVTANKKPERQEDIVERNKVTLGRNTFPGGSYRMAYAQKQGISHSGNKVTQICKEKKSQRKESPNLTLQKEQPPAPGVKAEHGDCLHPPSEKTAAVSQLKAQWTTSSHPNCPPSVNTPAHLRPLVVPEAVVSKSHPAYTYLAPASVAERTLSPLHQETDNPSQISQQGAVGRACPANQGTSPVHGQRIAAAKWASPSEGGDHKWIPDEFQCIPSPQRIPRTPTSSASLSLGSDTYSVLPPVGKAPTGKELELSPGHSVDTGDSIHRSSSDSYLGQMEKQKQLGAAYKAYSLKDYNQLQLNVTLRGLGPDYKAVEEAAEKMRRQRLYSNVIREHNKKISRMPFLQTKNLQGTDKKVPRMKALEYAKTIVKPCAQPLQAKQRQEGLSKGCEEHAPTAKGLLTFQPDTLAVLLKRHEEEKKAAAQRVPAV